MTGDISTEAMTKFFGLDSRKALFNLSCILKSELDLIQI